MNKKKSILIFIGAIAGLAVVALITLTITNQVHQRAEAERSRLAEREARKLESIEQAEAEAVATQVKARQSTNGVPKVKTINLKRFVNIHLNECRPSPKGVTNNSLGEVHRGKRVYGGVTFDVQGTIQLMGAGIKEIGGKAYPQRVEHIRIDRHCSKIHLLHGASFLTESAAGNTNFIGKLFLHYADGSKQEIKIVAGENVLDWWGPLYSTGADPRSITISSPNSELAWTGSNPYLQEQRPNWSLRLYKSTFANPNPNLELSSIDYASSVTRAAPFLVGLSIE
jgi:hypothetical protein